MVAGCLLIVPTFAAEGAAVVRIAVFVVMCIVMVRQTGFGSQLSALYVSLTKGDSGRGPMRFDGNGNTGNCLWTSRPCHGDYRWRSRLFRRAQTFENRSARGCGSHSGRFSGKMPAAIRGPLLKAAQFIAPLPTEDQCDPADETVHNHQPAEGAGRSAAFPVAFGDTIGLFMPENPAVTSGAPPPFSSSAPGVSRRCAAANSTVSGGRAFFGYRAWSSLRFDYIGTGDALDLPGLEPATKVSWGEFHPDCSRRT